MNEWPLTKIYWLAVFIIVIFLIGLVTLSKMDERESVYNLGIIATSMEMYKARHGGYPESKLNNVNDINAKLSLAIIEQYVVYDCRSNNAAFTCTAVSNYGWELNVSESDSGNPRCSVGTCSSGGLLKFFDSFGRYSWQKIINE